MSDHRTRSEVCTLFEGEYHYGVAVLTNSLFAAGYRGTVYAGFRGALPLWADGAVAVGDGRELQVADQLCIRFVRVSTDAHFTNYKPEFLQHLGLRNDGWFYLDPDVVVCEAWRFFEEWISCGVALCEDVNSPMSENHPWRVGWRRFFAERGYDLGQQSGPYVNGGMVGISYGARDFARVWADMLRYVCEAIGGSDYAGIPGRSALSDYTGFANCFSQPDQDALNAAMAASPTTVFSVMNQKAMGFLQGRAILPHAIGAAKPWARSYVREALVGRPPRTVDKKFWNYARGPVKAFNPSGVLSKRVALRLASGIGRIIKRA